MLRRLAIATAMALSMAAMPAFAADDPPARVGRLSYADGQVSSHFLDQEDWEQAYINDPVTVGYAAWTEPDARAEIQVGADAIRLDGTTEVDFVKLDEEAMVLRLPQGTIAVSLPQAGDQQQVVVETPRGQITLRHGGRYRVEAGTTDDPTVVAVFSGAARFEGDGSSLDVAQGQTAMAAGSDHYSYNLERTVQETPFDQWARGRDRPARIAANYVSPQMTGYEDLDYYGSWRSDPSYGTIWLPRQVPDEWAPYRYGRWRYVQPWGWTWVDDQPWGFAPFHYGRWVRSHWGWAWVPGTYAERPVYAPAMVTFFGSAGGVSFGVSLGEATEPVGWAPLGPGEVYYPWYQASPTYIRNVNITNVRITHINEVISNERYYERHRFINRRAATFVPAYALARADRVERARLHWREDQIRAARPIRPTVIREWRRPTRPVSLLAPGPEIRRGVPGRERPQLRSRQAVLEHVQRERQRLEQRNQDEMRQLRQQEQERRQELQRLQQRRGAQDREQAQRVQRQLQLIQDRQQEHQRGIDRLQGRQRNGAQEQRNRNLEQLQQREQEQRRELQRLQGQPQTPERQRQIQQQQRQLQQLQQQRQQEERNQQQEQRNRQQQQQQQDRERRQQMEQRNQQQQQQDRERRQQMEQRNQQQQQQQDRERRQQMEQRNQQQQQQDRERRQQMEQRNQQQQQQQDRERRQQMEQQRQQQEQQRRQPVEQQRQQQQEQQRRQQMEQQRQQQQEQQRRQQMEQQRQQQQEQQRRQQMEQQRQQQEQQRRQQMEQQRQHQQEQQRRQQMEQQRQQQQRQQQEQQRRQQQEQQHQQQQEQQHQQQQRQQQEQQRRQQMEQQRRQQQQQQDDSDEDRKRRGH